MTNTSALAEMSLFFASMRRSKTLSFHVSSALTAFPCHIDSLSLHVHELHLGLFVDPATSSNTRISSNSTHVP